MNVNAFEKLIEGREVIALSDEVRDIVAPVVELCKSRFQFHGKDAFFRKGNVFTLIKLEADSVRIIRNIDSGAAYAAMRNNARRFRQASKEA